VVFHQVALGSHHDSVGLVVPSKTVKHSTQVFPYRQGRMLGVVAVEWSISGQHEEQVTVVASEVLFAEVVGVLVAEVGPYRDVDVCSEVDEEVVEQLGFACSDAESEVVVGVVVVDGFVGVALCYFSVFGVIEVEE